MVKTLEGDRYALCEKLFLFPFCCSHQMHRYLAGCFGLISGRHCLITQSDIDFDAEFDEMVQTWKKNGGDLVTESMNAAYQEK